MLWVRASFFETLKSSKQGMCLEKKEARITLSRMQDVSFNNAQIDSRTKSLWSFLANEFQSSEIKLTLTKRGLDLHDLELFLKAKGRNN